MKELSVGEQRYHAVMAVLSDGRTVTEVARDWDVSRQTMHAWLARYERAGMEGALIPTSPTVDRRIC
jgi:transposase-like protein